LREREAMITGLTDSKLNALRAAMDVAHEARTVTWRETKADILVLLGRLLDPPPEPEQIAGLSAILGEIEVGPEGFVLAAVPEDGRELHAGTVVTFIADDHTVVLVAVFDRETFEEKRP